MPCKRFVVRAIRSLLILVALLVGAERCVAWQSIHSFRELDRGDVPSPSELSRFLEQMDLVEVTMPKSNARNSSFEDLAKAGRKIYENMPPEQRQKMESLARKAFSDRSSPEARQVDRMLDSFGVSSTDRETLRQLYTQSQKTDPNVGSGSEAPKETQKKLPRRTGSERTSGDRDDTASADVPGNRAKPKGLPRLDPELMRRLEDRQKKAAEAERNRQYDDGFSLEQLGKNSSDEPKGSGENSKPNGGARNKESDAKSGTQARDESTNRRRDTKQRSSVDGEKGTTGAQLSNRTTESLIDDLKTQPNADTIKELVKRKEWLSESGNSKSNNGSNGSAGRSKLDQKTIQQIEKALGELSKNGKLADLAKKYRPSASGQPGSARSAQKSSPGSEPTTRQDVEGKKGLWSGFLEKAKKTLSGEVAEKPKEKIGTIFDRTMVKAAREMVKSGRNQESGESGESGVSKFLDSFFESAVEKVENRLNRNSKNGQNGDRRGRRWRNDVNDANNLGLNNTRPRTSPRRSSGAIRDNGGRDFGWTEQMQNVTNSTSEILPSSLSMPGKLPLSEMPWNWILIAGILLAVVVGLIFLGVRASMGEREPASEVAMKKRLRRSIRSSSNLIEAFDNFLLFRFGNRSDWWNVRKAEKILTVQLPEYSARIETLVDDYETGRYSPTAKPANKDSHQSTLDELLKADLNSESNQDES